MKPLLKSYVLFVPVDEGVYFEAGQDSFLLKGRGIFPLVARMASLLDGSRTAAALESVIPEKARPLFALLLAELQRKRMLHMVPETAEPPLPERIEAAYAGTIGYLKDQSPDWAAAFRRWRETATLAVGAGIAYRVMVRNLLRSGVRELLLAPDAAGDAAADRPAIDSSVAEAAGRDPDLSVRWLEPDRAFEAAAAGGVRILYMSDDVPTAEDSLFRRLIALDRPGTLAGGIAGGHALVGPELGDGIPLLSTWDRFSAGEPGLPLPRSARAILGSLAAFEALKSLLFDESDEAERRGWLRRHCYHLRADATIEVHALAPARAATADAPAPADAAAAGPADDDPLFDPVTGSLRWEDFSGAEFPLPHRAVAVRPTGATVTQWSLTPQDLDERTTARALESLAEGDRPADGDSADCASSPIVAARDEAAWRAEARAQAVARHPLFLRDAAPVRVDPESVGDQDARTLFRLVRLYTGAVPDLSLAGGDGWGASVALVTVDGRTFRSAAATPGRAMIEALGDALSALQTDRAPERQLQPYLGPLGSAAAPDEAGGGDADALRFEEVRLSPAGAASRGWIVGYVRARR